MARGLLPVEAVGKANFLVTSSDSITDYWQLTLTTKNFS
jgi:hypothetical protein